MFRAFQPQHNDAPGNSFPDWLQIDFAGPRSIDEIDVLTGQDNWANPSEPTEALTFSQYGLTAYSDQLGTPRMVMDKTGSLSGVYRHDYLPFGEEIGAGREPEKNLKISAKHFFYFGCNIDNSLVTYLTGKVNRILRFNAENKPFCYIVEARLPDDMSKGMPSIASLTYYDEDGDEAFEVFESGRLEIEPRIPSWAVKLIKSQ